MRALLCLMAAATFCWGCSTIKEVKERQTTHAEIQVAAEPDSVLAAALDVLPEFHMIATATYWKGGFIQAQGDWDSEQEGALVQISVKPNSAGTLLVVEAGNSSFDSNERKLALARAIGAKVKERFLAEESQD